MDSAAGVILGELLLLRGGQWGSVARLLPAYPGTAARQFQRVGSMHQNAVVLTLIALRSSRDGFVLAHCRHSGLLLGLPCICALRALS